MNSEIILSLLSFGDTGMEFISGQFRDSLDEDYVTLIGNFYSNVLGAAEESNGLFGPLPVAYKYDILLFLYAFNAFDPGLQDERVIKRNHMTRASLLIFFPATMDGLFSNQRKSLKNIIERWCFEKEKKDIRKTSKKEINELRESILALISKVQNKTDFNLLGSNLVVITGKNLSLLNTIASIYNKNIKISFVSNVDSLDEVIKRIVFSENLSILSQYKKENINSLYSLNKVEITSNVIAPTNLVHKYNLKHVKDGIFYFFSTNQLEDSDVIIKSILKVINEIPKNSILSLCFSIETGFSEIINDEEISYALSKEIDRSISLINLKDHKDSIEIAIVDFFEKIVSQYS